ncbi:MAG TPA: hypothetical protein ENM98_00955, partial [Halothiobacillaceae bacterium]|nr:hypothetical protein [Halothiobacillaceae bacterium]
TLGLPNNSVRILSGCGIAASIAAAFNTPLAGVIFAMEVIVKQYTLASFLPVIIAASIGALVTTTVFGPEPAFNIQIEHALTWGDVPVLIVLGLFIGAMAAGYIQMVESTITRTWSWPVWARFTAAGIATGLLGIWIPEVMGIGYDTTELIAGAQIALMGLVMIAIAKWILAGITVGLGLPVGTIAPVLMIGSAIGGIAGALMYHFQQIPVADVAFYVVLGMGAMMGATLQAPLAALTAVLELTSDTAAIMPAMFIIVIAGLASRMLFGKAGLYDAMLRANDQQMQGPSLWFNGDNIGVSSVINRQIGRLKHPCNLQSLQNTLEEKPTWLVLEDEEKNTLGVIRSNPARAALEHAYTEAFNQAYAKLQAQQEKLRAHLSSTPNTDEEMAESTENSPRGDLIPAIDTEALAAEVMQTTEIDLTQTNAFYRAADVEVGYTLTQAQQVMRTLDVEVLVARRQTRAQSARPLGVLTVPMIEQAISEREP